MMNLSNKLEGLKLDNKKLLLAGIICLIVLYVDISFIMKLQLNGIKAISPKIAKLKKDISNLSKDLSRLQALERDRAALPQLQVVRPKEVVSEDKILLVLQEISSIGNDRRVKIAHMNTAKDAKAQEEVIAGERLSPVIITLDLSCNYHSLGGFLSAIENAQYFIEVQDMRILRDQHDYLLENVNLTLKTYAKK